jgi:hypothetical protein
MVSLGAARRSGQLVLGFGSGFRELQSRSRELKDAILEHIEQLSVFLCGPSVAKVVGHFVSPGGFAFRSAHETNDTNTGSQLQVFS